MSTQQFTGGMVLFGHVVRHFREDVRQWKRPKLLNVFHDKLDEAGIEYEPKAEAWLKRLEDGDKIAPLPIEWVYALANALDMNEIQTAQLLLLAGYSVFSNVASSDIYARGLTYFFTVLFSHAHKFSKIHIDREQAKELNEAEWIELGWAILGLIKDRMEN